MRSRTHRQCRDESKQRGTAQPDCGTMPALGGSASGHAEPVSFRHGQVEHERKGGRCAAEQDETAAEEEVMGSWV